MMEIYDGRLWWDGGASCEARPATKDLQQVLSRLVDIFFWKGCPWGSTQQLEGSVSLSFLKAGCWCFAANGFLHPVDLIQAQGRSKTPSPRVSLASAGRNMSLPRPLERDGRGCLRSTREWQRWWSSYFVPQNPWPPWGSWSCNKHLCRCF